MSLQLSLINMFMSCLCVCQGFFRKGCALEALKRYDEVSDCALLSQPLFPYIFLSRAFLIRLASVSLALTLSRRKKLMPAGVLMQALAAFKEAAALNPKSQDITLKIRGMTRLARDSKRSAAGKGPSQEKAVSNEDEYEKAKVEQVNFE